MRNMICETMGWPIPTKNQKLLLKWDGKVHAELTSARNGCAEGVYLLEAGPGVSNACFSAWPGDSAENIKQGLAKKLFANARNLKKGEIHELVKKLPLITFEMQEKSYFY